MYRIALDQNLEEEKNIGFKVCRNIGNAFVRIGKYCNKIQNYEAAMSSSLFRETDVNVLLCYAVLGDAEKVNDVLPQLYHFP